MLLFRIEKKNLHISTRHVEKCSGFITLRINSLSLVTVMLNVRFVRGLNRAYNHKNRVMLLFKTEKKNWYISPRYVEICSGFILITMAFHKFSCCNAKYMVYFTIWKEFYIHTHKNKVMLFIKIQEKQRYIWTCHVDNISGFILINMGFRKIKYRHAKLALEIGYTIFRFKITRIKSCYR
jgi:hypothetical protein